jgi:hypothetical protein
MSFNLIHLSLGLYGQVHSKGNSWEESYYEKPHKNPEEETSAKSGRSGTRPSTPAATAFPELPLVNYTSQYGMGCFEGLKAFPQKDGSLKLFRPGQNGQRMANSMEGLHMPVYPKELLPQECANPDRQEPTHGLCSHLRLLPGRRTTSSTAARSTSGPSPTLSPPSVWGSAKLPGS